jgi:NitT/TauT family transport system substrate-binding protein
MNSVIAMRPERPRAWAFRAVAAALLVVAAAFGPGTASAADATALKLQIYAGGSQIPPLITQKNGFFEKNGLKVDLVPVQNGPEAMNALLSGSVNLAIVAPLNTANILAKGEKLSAIGGMQRNYMSIVGAKGDSVKWPDSLLQLRGKRLGVLALKGGNQLICEIALRAAGLKENDFTFVATGSEIASAAALDQGKVDAVCTSTLSQIKLVHEGYPILFDFLNAGAVDQYPPALQAAIGLSFNQFWVRSDWLASNVDAVTKFRRAMAQNDVWMKDPKNLGALVKQLRGTMFDVPSADDKEYSDYVKLILSSVQFQIPETDPVTWDGITKTAFGVGMPPASDWIADGTPKTPADVEALASGR